MGWSPRLTNAILATIAQKVKPRGNRFRKRINILVLNAPSR